MTHRRIGLFIAALLAGSALSAQEISIDTPVWPAVSSSSSSNPQMPRGFYQRPEAELEIRGIRLWEFRFEGNQAAPLIKNGALELDFEGTGLSLRARF